MENLARFSRLASFFEQVFTSYITTGKKGNGNKGNWKKQQKMATKTG